MKPLREAPLPASAKRDGPEVRADINLGHACNNRCRFCMQGHSSKAQRAWLPLEKLREELRHYAQDKGFTSLGLLGGEPTLYPHLFEALDIARELGFSEITINSNGYKLADETFAHAAVEHGINRFCLSVHSETPSIEDDLSGRKGSFKTKLTALRNLLHLQKQGGINNISLNAVLTRQNLPGLLDYIRFYTGLGLRDLRFNVVRPEGRAAEMRDMVPQYKEIMPSLLQAVVQNERHWHIRLSFGEIPYCQYPESWMDNDHLRSRYIGEYIDRRTAVSSFNNPGAELADEDGRQRFTWQDLKADVLKRFVPACERCPWASVCGGVWINYLEMYGDEEFHKEVP